jgi:hypothetical protein
MRLLTILLSLISLAGFPLIALANPASTIDELTAAYSIETCADCHEDIHEEWKNSWHGKPVIDPRVLRTWRTFILSGLDKSRTAERKNLKEVCLPCHAPLTQDASEELIVQIADMIVTAVEDQDKAKREEAVKELSKLDINCLVCHNVKALPGGNPQPKTIYGPRGSKDTPHKEESGMETAKSDFLTTSEFCAQCHHGCPPGMPSSICPTLYSSYKEQYLAHGGEQTCQGCHMKGDDYKSHRFPGIYKIDQAQQGIEITLNARPTTFVYHLENRLVPAVVTNIQVKNTAGHGIPHG